MTSDFRPAPSRVAGEHTRRLDHARRALRFHHAFLDDQLRGILPHDLVLISAATGCGKTEIATSIAKANARAGRRVAFFALEAEPDEIERRIKYAILVELAAAANQPGVSSMNYIDWVFGEAEAVLGPFDDQANQIILEQFSMLRTFYRASSFTPDDVERQFRAVQGEVDLIVLDHVHFLDLPDEDEHRGVKRAAQLIRSTAIDMGVPVILIAHQRKLDRRAQPVAPSIDDIHGSSDLVKIATQVIQLAPASHVIESSRWYLSPTFVQVTKDRRGGATGHVALCHYDRRSRDYSGTYALGRVIKGGTAWEQLKVSDVPRWARRHQPLEVAP